MTQDDDWDASSSDGDAAPKAAPKKTAPKVWDDDNSDVEPQETQVADDATVESSPQDNSNKNPNTKNENANNKNQNQKQKQQNQNQNQNQNKQNKNNNNNNNKNKNKNKNQKKGPPRQVSTASKKQAKKYDSDSTTSSDDSSDETQEQQKANAKMQSYDDRYSEDNAILFGAKNKRGGQSGGRGRGRGRGRGGRGGRGGGSNTQERPMLSGEVRLSSFPLGGQRDCINLARQLTGLINQRRFDGDINGMDIVKFVTYMMDGLIAKNSNHIDIVDINEIKTQVDKIYNRKQKELRAGKKKSFVCARILHTR